MNDDYGRFVAGADKWDKAKFDAFLIDWLLNSRTEDERQAALEAAAAHVNEGRS